MLVLPTMNRALLLHYWERLNTGMADTGWASFEISVLHLPCYSTGAILQYLDSPGSMRAG